MEVVVDQAAPVGDEVSKLANQFSLIPEDYDITVRHPETKAGKPFELKEGGGETEFIIILFILFAVTSLSRELTFAEQDVAELSTLFLKPKVFLFYLFIIARKR
jgi:hypothetical protein